MTARREINEEALELALKHYGFSPDDPKAREIAWDSFMYAYWDHRLAWRALWDEITKPLVCLMRWIVRFREGSE